MTFELISFIFYIDFFTKTVKEQGLRYHNVQSGMIRWMQILS